jgi:hypothetical protein
MLLTAILVQLEVGGAETRASCSRFEAPTMIEVTARLAGGQP